MPKTCEIWLCVSAEGDYAVGADEDSAKSSFESEIQEIEDTGGFRLFKLNLTVPLPDAVTLSGEVAEGQSESIELTVEKS